MLDTFLSEVKSLFNQIETASSDQIKNIIKDISSLKHRYLGKKEGLFAAHMKAMVMTKDREKIQEAQSIRDRIYQELETLQQEAVRKDAILSIKKVDLDLNTSFIQEGSISPLRKAKFEIIDIMEQFGFKHIKDRLIEDDYHNFTALNIPEFHPARNMHDTFYLTNNKLLRTHTSTVQIRHMSKNQPPFQFVSSGPVFRYDMDATHSPMFSQIEGVLLKEGVSFADLKSFLVLFLKQFFETDNIEVRFRPSYFPFTQPSAEVDIKRNGKWLEVLGCGMIHENVLANLNIDKKYTGFAFGMGIDRLAMLKYNMNDLRKFYSGSIEWSQQNNFKKV